MRMRHRVLLLSLVMLLGVASQLIQSTAVFAARIDPIVVVAVDTTNLGGACTMERRSNIHTAHETVSTMPCPAGTVIKSMQVPLSQATANHEPFVSLTSTQAAMQLGQLPASLRDPIQQLMRAKQHRAAPAPQLTTNPPEGCSPSTKSVTITWNPVSPDAFQASESYFDTCSTIVVEQASMMLLRDTGEGSMYWDMDKYAGSSWNVPGRPYMLPAGTTFYHDVDQSGLPRGYYYENWTDFGNGYRWDDIGPLS